MPWHKKSPTGVGRTLLLVCVLSQMMSGQKPESAQASAELGPRIAEAVRIDRPPRLDGTLDDPLWQQASPITDFKQREPYEGQPATERTEVRLLYSRNEIYFGIACHDSAVNGPVATQLRRDVSQELDDYFEIVIDSRHDGRNAYVFQINPLGTQRDALITDEQAGDTQDLTWTLARTPKVLGNRRASGRSVKRGKQCVSAIGRDHHRRTTL